MDYRTDTGCMLPGRGDTSPLPQGVTERSMEQRMHDLEQRVAQLEARDRMWRTVLSQFLSQSNNATSVPQYPPVLPPDVNPPPAAASDQETVLLPQMFAASVKHDARRARELVRLLRDVIAPAASQRRQKPYTWFHVRMVMLHRGLIDERTTVTSFSRDMAQVLLGERDTEAWQHKADNLRHATTNYEIPKQVNEVLPDYQALPDGNNIKESCRRVEEALADVL